MVGNLALSIIKQEELFFPEGEKLSLVIQSWSNAARDLNIHGFTKFKPFKFAHTTNADRSINETVHDIVALPISLQVFGPVPTKRGELYVKVTLRILDTQVAILAAGYITTDMLTLTWPPKTLEHSVSGIGNTRSITGTDPAVNTEISETVPTNAVWKLKSLRFTLVAAAVAVDRTVQVIIDDGTNILWTNRVHDVQQNAETRQYNFAKDLEFHATEDATGDLHSPLPSLILKAGYRIRTVTTNRDAGDNYSAPQLQVEEFLEE